MNIAQMLFSFDGRMRRRDFWLCTIGLFVVAWIIEAIIGAMFFPAMMAGAGPNGVNAAGWAAMSGMMGAYGIVGLILIWPSLAIAIKRCHDRDQTGWWVLLMLIPIVGIFWWLINLGILDGTPGPNKFGPSPKDATAPAAA